MSDDFTSRTLRALNEAADERRNQMLAEDLAQQALNTTDATDATPLGLRARLASWFTPRTFIAACVGGAIAALVIVLIRPETPTLAPVESPAALDGGAEGTHESELVLTRDAQGRLVELAPKSLPTTGQRIQFRGERLVRIETYRQGKLHGSTLEFDLRGQLVSLRQFVDGIEVLPPLRLDSDGKIRDTP